MPKKKNTPNTMKNTHKDDSSLKETPKKSDSIENTSKNFAD